MDHLYIRLAWTNIKNSRQFYLPYLLTGILCTAMFYIMTAMSGNSGLQDVRGSASLQSVLTLGSYVVGIFVCIFLFYTNSFIIKRRKKELGIYNILGMEKRHIMKELAAETFFAAAVSITTGLAIGILFNKFMIMLLYQMSGLSTPIQFELSVPAAIKTVELFLLIYLAALLYNVLQVRLSNPVELLHGTNAGEREPKTKLLLSFAGVACIGAGYYIALTTQNPLKALTLFFVAVVLVIIGTYCLFTSASIALLKALRKNKKFYYQTRHFIAVSGMIYRMKQNAVGLANICILSTMVLVMVSSTVCLYVGADDELTARYPAEISIRGFCDERPAYGELEKEIEDVIRSNGRTITKKSSYSCVETAALYNEANHSMAFPSDSERSFNNLSKISLLYIMTKQDYEADFNTTLAPVSESEIAVIGTPVYESSELTLFGQTYAVAKSNPAAIDTENYLTRGTEIEHMYYIIMPNQAAMDEFFTYYKAQSSETEPRYSYHFNVDIDGTKEEKLACDQAVIARLNSIYESNQSSLVDGIFGEYREVNHLDFYAQNGAFLFLGIFLGTLFLMVTVLIIFYKQISEGYDDRERFQIMEKVGMSRREVRATIFAQVRIVFILPIITAAFHVTAAFPMIQKLLLLMNLTNAKLFACCLAGTILIFSVIYLLVFLLTSKSYCRIVDSKA